MEPFLAQIMLFGGNFAPRGWAFCDGQLLPISSNSALFSLLGTIYGGDGRTTFALPDLRGRAPIHAGTGPGLSPRRLGEKVGVEDVTLNVTQMPSHNHGLMVANQPADNSRPSADMLGRAEIYTSNLTSPTPLAAQSIANAGGGQSHENMQPSIAMNYIIALQGIFPSRS
ncbi:tail fiber protein [Aliiroseovarius crassostreae]|uniref:phage tail protein n=1 Tax=Aliiroseovarius crassostreae TaxID=154981 RepID=UPI0021FE62C0|nr:tail fiber protein [Aliiroseovarius crassostreae]UWQ09217.1 tail fiber protein [Aliiroseovarius crassostreae]UWQ12294.1 tail fiber protein [Aliiroseovarius crassostreae]